MLLITLKRFLHKIEKVVYQLHYLVYNKGIYILLTNQNEIGTPLVCNLLIRNETPLYKTTQIINRDPVL